MELHPPAKGYEIKQAKTPITIVIRPLDSLRPHEEIVREELELLSSSIQSDKVLRHPIIADTETGIVLDGTHRLLALKQLGCRTAPVALVDYQSPTITIERWYRIIDSSTISDVAASVKDLGLVMREAEPEVASRMLNEKSVIAVLQDNENAVTFNTATPIRDTLEMVRTGFRLESVLREEGHRVSYTDSRPESLSKDTLTLSMIKLSKPEVISTAMSGRLYPPKSTRHLIPSRPLGTRVPIDWLAKEDAETAQSRLMEHLGRLKLTRLAEGSTVGSRRYSEEVFLFG